MVSGRNYEGLDPSELEQWRRRANVPHDYARLTTGSGGRGRQGGGGEKEKQDGVESKSYEGLNAAEVEEMRQRQRRPVEYAALRDTRQPNVEDLYSVPIKKHLRR